MNMKRILSIIIIWSMLVGNIAFAQEMLAPVVHIDASLFQQGYNQAIEATKLDYDSTDADKIIARLILESAELKNNQLIRNFLEKFQDAYEKFQEGEGYIALYEGALKAANHSAQIYANKDVKALPLTAVEFWNKSNDVLNSIDMQTIENILPKEKNQIIYYFLSFKAQVLLNIIEGTEDSTGLNHVANYALIKQSLERAFSLSGLEPGFADLSRMANACANLAADPRLSLDKQMELCSQALFYFDMAIDQAGSLPNGPASKQLIESMYYSYFTTLYFTGDVAKAQGDYDQAIMFYDKVVPLVPKLLLQPNALPGLKGFYVDYYRMLWTVSNDFYDKSAKESAEDKNKIKRLYTKTRETAKAFIQLLSSLELFQGVGLDPLVCIAEVSDVLLQEDMKVNNWQGVSDNLKLYSAALEELNAIKTHDQHENFLIAKQNIVLIETAHKIFKTYIKQQGLTKDSIKQLAAMLDAAFFAEFLNKLQSNEYQDILEKLKSADDLENEVLFTQKLYSDSAANNLVRVRLQKVLNSNSPDKVQRAKFNKAYGYLTRITLANTYLYEGSYARAKQMIIDASDFSERFESTKSIVLDVFPQAVLAGKEGKTFITELFFSRAGTKFKNNVIKHKDFLSARSIALLKDIFLDPTNQRLLKDNQTLLESLEIVPNAPEEKPAKKPVIHGEVVQTVDVLKTRVNEALAEVKMQAIANPKRAKNKGNKQAKKQKSFDANSPSMGYLRNKLKAMTDSNQKRPSQEIVKYLKDIVLEESICKNPVVMSALVQAIMKMDAKTATEILEIYTGIFSENDPAVMEVDRGLKYFHDLEVFEKGIQDIEQRISGININKLTLAQVNEQLTALEKKSNNLIKEFADIIMQFGKEPSFKYSEKIAELISAQREQSKLLFEQKKDAFFDQCAVCEQELNNKLNELLESDKPAVEKIIDFKFWLRDQRFFDVDEEILPLPEVQTALGNLSSLWNRIKKNVQAEIELLSFISKNRIKFEISEDISAVHFEQVELIMATDKKSKQQIIQEMYEVIKVVYLHNPRIDIQTSITGTEHPNSQGIFPPLVDGAKAKIIEVQTALRIAHDYDVFLDKYEKAIKEILFQDITALQRIKQIRDLLTGEFEDPDMDLVDDSEGIMERTLENFSQREKTIYAQQRQTEIIAKRQLRLEIEGEYKSLIFTPLAEKIDIRKAEAEIRAIWQEALTYNIDIQMQVGEGIDPEHEWVQDIADLWDQEYELAFKQQEKTKLIQTDITVDPQAVTENAQAIAQAI